MVVLKILAIYLLLGIVLKFISLFVKEPVVVRLDDLIRKRYTGMSLVFWSLVWFGKFDWETQMAAERRRQRTIMHEAIHYHQWKELWFVNFPLVYLFYYLKGRFKGMNHDKAYRSIPMEKEAYDNAEDPTYFLYRKKFEWTKYI